MCVHEYLWTYVIHSHTYVRVCGCVCVPPYVRVPARGRAVTLTYITHLIGYFNGTTSEINKYINKQSNSAPTVNIDL